MLVLNFQMQYLDLLLRVAEPMSQYAARYISGIGEFTACAEKWNQLWSTSYPTPATVRYEGIVNWAKTFKQEKGFSAIVIESGDDFVLGMPLCKAKLRGLLPTTALTGNSWSDCGNLLVDQRANSNSLDRLLESLQRNTNGLLALEAVPVETPQWQAFLDAVGRQQGAIMSRWRREVAVVDIFGDWQSYQDSWTSKYRTSIKRSIKKIEQEYQVRVERFRHLDAAELKEKIQLAFEIEDRSWKGENGTSVLKTAGMLEHFQREAMEAMRAGFLDLWFLWANDRPIAFEYCHIANEVCYSNKMGFDAEFARFGPGRILRYFQLQGLHEDGNCRLFDMLGLIDESKAKWSTRFYPVENLTVALKPQTMLLLRGGAAVKSWWASEQSDNQQLVPGAKLNSKESALHPVLSTSLDYSMSPRSPGNFAAG